MEDYRAPMEHQWSPYSWNGGTILAVAGEDFAVIASDTRLSEGFQIYTRDSPKTYKMSDTAVLGCSGFHGDVLTLIKVIEAQQKIYQHTLQKDLSCESLAQLLATILYTRRFFPYYTYNILAGLDKKGKGCVYSFDPVGSYDREMYRAGGSAAAMLQPLLDNQVALKNQAGVEKEPLTIDKAVSLVTDVFTSAAERDIYTGDGVKISIITASGIDVKEVPLRRD